MPAIDSSGHCSDGACCMSRGGTTSGGRTRNVLVGRTIVATTFLIPIVAERGITLSAIGCLQPMINEKFSG